MSSPQDIWSTRLQKEILALVADNDDDNAAAAAASKKDIGILPPFIIVKEHNLDLIQGKCSVSFAIQVEASSTDFIPTTPPTPTPITTTASTSADKENDNDNDNNNDEKESSIPNNENTNNETIPSKSTQPSPVVIITLDASLQRPVTIGSIIHNEPDISLSYPFFKPKAFLTSGAELLPSSTGISNGSMIPIDCDWTPSLHLNDAVLNIALKVRESIKRDEPCLKAEHLDSTTTLESIDSKVSSFFSSLKTKASAIVEDVDSKLDVAMRDNNNNSSNSSTNSKLTLLKKRGEYKPAPTKAVTEENVEIGDIIELSQGPWNKAVGMYPCNAIRRPVFIEEAMKAVSDAQQSEKVSEELENENELNQNYLRLQSGSVFQVAGSGFKGATSMFKSFSKSAKSFVEESFLFLTQELILEIKCNKFSVSSATVSFCIPISHLSKLKFRREESISLFFKEAPDDPIIYICHSSADAVKQIQAILKQHGVKGKHTNTTMTKAVQLAVEFLNDVKEKEIALVEDPRPERVTEIMDLYRQAAEQFEMAGDKRHEEAMSLMREFLAQPHVSGILDGSINPKQNEMEASAILEPVTDFSELDTSMDNDDQEVDSKEDEHFDKAIKAAEDMLNDAHDELKDLGVEDDEIENSFDDIDVMKSNDEIDSTAETTNNKDVVSEFEDMLADADKELEELMGV